LALGAGGAICAFGLRRRGDPRVWRTGAARDPRVRSGFWRLGEQKGPHRVRPSDAKAIVDRQAGVFALLAGRDDREAIF
jgi:hypothetical protein